MIDGVELAEDRRKRRDEEARAKFGPHGLGSSVRHGKIRYSSVSQIVLFDPAIEGGCPRKWAFPYVFSKKLPRVDAQKDGEKFGEKLELYLRTAKDLLPPILQPAKKYLPQPGPDLECEEFLGDMVKAVAFRDVLLSGVLPMHLAADFDQVQHHGLTGTWQSLVQREIEEAAGLTAAGIPLDGAADVRHFRGYYVDGDGELRQEAVGTVVAEVDDFKSAKRIDGRWTRGKTNYLRGFGKSDAEVCEHTQMVGYGQHAANRWSELTHVRLAHVIAQKEPVGYAAKRGGLVPVDLIRERWYKRGDLVMEQMIQVAGAQKIEDVAPNPAACDTYSHVGPDGKTAPGCGHRLYCPQKAQEFVPFMMSGTAAGKEIAGMSLFDRTPPGAPPPPTSAHTNGAAPAPPATPTMPVADNAAYLAEVAAHKARLLAEDALARARSKIAAGTLKLDPNGQVHDREGASSDSGWILRPPTEAEKAAFMMAPTPPDPSAVRPPDAPLVSTLNGARPITPAQRAEITDPDLLATVDAHAEIHAEHDAAVAAQEAEEKRKREAEGGVWCPGGSQRIKVTTAMAMARKYRCQCGKEIGLKPVEETPGSGEWVSSLPRHKLPKAEGAGAVTPPSAVAPPPPASAPQPPVQVPAGVPTQTMPDGSFVDAPPPPPPPPPVAPLPLPEAAQLREAQMTVAAAQVDAAIGRAQDAAGVVIYVDVLVERGAALLSLEDYYTPIVRKIEQQAKVMDLRAAVDKPLGFGGWKGVLAGFCRAEPPTSGSYYARGGDEVAEAVVAALSPSCRAVYRPVGR